MRPWEHQKCRAPWDEARWVRLAPLASDLPPLAQYVVIPTRRATAVALQSFTSHLPLPHWLCEYQGLERRGWAGVGALGGGPALTSTGSPTPQISDLIRQSTKDSPLWEFLSLGYALMLCPFVVVLGGMFFLATALFFLSDRAKAEQQ